MALFRRALPAGETRVPAAIEQRAPAAATKSLRYVTPGRAQPPDWDAASAFEWAYYCSIVVYACTRLYANTLSGLPFRVGADPAKPKDFDPNAPLAKLLGPPPGGPAPKLSARRLWAWTVAQRIVTGRNAWEIETAPGADVPLALWPLASGSLTPIPTTGGTDWFAAFDYGRSGDKRRLGADAVVYDWDPSGNDFRQPESALRAANLDIAVSVMQSKFDYSFLKNDARPAAVVVTEAFEDEDSYDAFRRQFNAEHRGPDNAGKLAFVEALGNGEQGVKGAVDVTVLGISAKDSQAAQRHLAAMEHVAIALGTPWSLLDASARTFSNAGQEWTNWVTTRLLPLIADFQDMVNMQLAPRLGNLVGWFDLCDLGIDTAVDPVTAQVGAPAMVQAQLMTINEARADYGLPPAPDGDRFMSPDEIAALNTGPAVLRSPDPEGGHVEVREGLSDPLPSGLPALDHEARRAKLWTSTNGKVRNLERQWERGLRRLFARQSRSAVARLEAKRGRSLAAKETRDLGDEVFDPFHWLAETEDDVTGLYEAVTAAGGARVSDLFGLAFDLEAPFAQNFIKDRAKKLAGQVTETTYDAIKATLAEGTGLGEAIPDLAARIRAVFDEASQTRAGTIARTEVISAFNGSASMTASSYGTDVVAGQEWIATRDDRTRDEHVARDGEIVGIDESFSGGLAYPGDPDGDPEDVINCRCTVAFLTPDEMTSRAGGRARMIQTRVAHAVLSLVREGTDERTIRAALKAVA